jgi:hypothetical protein
MLDWTNIKYSTVMLWRKIKRGIIKRCFEQLCYFLRNSILPCARALAGLRNGCGHRMFGSAAGHLTCVGDVKTSRARRTPFWQRAVCGSASVPAGVVVCLEADIFGVRAGCVRSHATQFFGCRCPSRCLGSERGAAAKCKRGSLCPSPADELTRQWMERKRKVQLTFPQIIHTYCCCYVPRNYTARLQRSPLPVQHRMPRTQDDAKCNMCTYV